jgi:uncharacterized protein
MPDDDLIPPRHFAVTAAAFEGSIAVVAVGLGWMLRQAPLTTFSWNWTDAAWGLAATLPMLALLGACLLCPWRPFMRIFQLINEVLVPLFAQCRLLEFAGIAMLAGLGEEMLFRGVIQSYITRAIGEPMGPWIGLCVGGLLFGLAHSITFTYVLLAGAIGVYLGWIWIVTDNLLTPIIAHAAYDFAALIYLVKIRPQHRKAG